MLKLVSTEMNEHEVVVSVNVISDSDSSSCDCQVYSFPMTMVNPRIALQIATLLVSDPTVPHDESKKE